MSCILFLSQLLPYPPDAGAKVRSYYVLRHLTQKHRVTLLAFSRLDDSPEAVQHLRKFCEDVHLIPMHRSQIRNLLSLATSLLKGVSFIIQRDYVPEMAQEIDRLLQVTPVRCCPYRPVMDGTIRITGETVDAKRNACTGRA